MFEFGIIICADGMEIIDRSMTTPYSALTPLQMADYMEVDAQIAVMEMLARKAKREAEEQRKKSRSLIYKAACLFRLV